MLRTQAKLQQQKPKQQGKLQTKQQAKQLELFNVAIIVMTVLDHGQGRVSQNKQPLNPEQLNQAHHSSFDYDPMGRLTKQFVSNGQHLLLERLYISRKPHDPTFRLPY